jgi:hypothetical protein
MLGSSATPILTERPLNRHEPEAVFRFNTAGASDQVPWHVRYAAIGPIV